MNTRAQKKDGREGKTAYAITRDLSLIANYGPPAADARRRSLITAIADCADVRD
jgi:hypothetical protein